MAGNPQIRHAVFALVGLALLAGLGFVIGGGGTPPAPPQPGEDAFRAAAKQVVAKDSQETVFGDVALAQALKERLDALPEVQQPARVHAQRSASGTCFLVGLPGQKLTLEARKPFLVTAWGHAAEVAGQGRVVVALRGALTLAGVARGDVGGPAEVISGLAVVPTELFEFYAQGDAAPVTSDH
jgi:hypothetical protein